MKHLIISVFLVLASVPQAYGTSCILTGKSTGSTSCNRELGMNDGILGCANDPQLNEKYISGSAQLIQTLAKTDLRKFSKFVEFSARVQNASSTTQQQALILGGLGIKIDGSKHGGLDDINQFMEKAVERDETAPWVQTGVNNWGIPKAEVVGLAESIAHLLLGERVD